MYVCVCVSLGLCRDDAYRASPSPCTLLLLFLPVPAFVLFFSRLSCFILFIAAVAVAPLRCVVLRVSCAAAASPLGTCGSAATTQCDAADDDDDVADLLACECVCVCECCVFVVCMCV